MVDNLGRWTMEKDYSVYPKEKWCDYDHVANWINITGYKINTSMENLATKIFLLYDEELVILGQGYIEVPYKTCTGDYSPNMEDIKLYVKNCGGLKAFDYE